MSKPNLVIRNALWRGEKTALIVSKGKVLELKPAGEAIELDGAEVVDAEGLLLLPSLTDAHAHLREPGHEYKEDIASGLKAAAFGGFGQVMAMANTNPVNDNATVTELMLAQAKASWPKGPRLLPVGALSKGLECRELTPMAELAKAGCVAISNDGMPVQSAEFFRRAVEYASDFGLKVIDHCEDPSMGLGLGVNEGRVSSLLGLKGQPTVAESLHVARDILLAAYLDLPIHLAHISCRESVELIHAAKAKGVPVTAETCPHYLVFTEQDVDGYNTAAKVNPPLRTPDDVLALRQGLREGVIDILVTDHAPHADFEKEVPFAGALCGISGLDTGLSLCMKLVQENALDLGDVIRAWGTRPCEIYKLKNNAFAPGDPANFLLFDQNTPWEVTPDTLHSKGKNTPLMGTTLPGRLKALFLKGKRIV